MRSYLSQIINRASGMAETDHIKPTGQGWPVVSSEAVSDPFEQIESVKSPPAQVPEKNPEPLTTDRPPDEVILADTPGREKRASDLPSEQTSRLSPRPSADFAVPPLPHEKEGEIIEHPGPDQSDRPPPHPFLESSTASDVKDVPTEIKQPIPRDIDNAEYAKEEKSVSHQPPVHSLPTEDLGLETKDRRLKTGDTMPASGIQYPASSIQHPASSEYTPGEAGQTDPGERKPVSELSPRPPISPVTSPVYRKDSREKRLVIGRLKVEAVKEPPATNQKRAVRIAPRRQQPQREIGLSRSKLRFGLGQM